MISPIKQKIIYTALATGMMLAGLQIVASYLTNKPAGIAIILWLLVFLVPGIIAGFVLRDKLKNSYEISIFALFFTEAASRLFIIPGYFLYILAAAVFSVGAFYLSVKYFGLKRLNKALKIIFATVFLTVFAVFCGLARLYLDRLVYY